VLIAGVAIVIGGLLIGTLAPLLFPTQASAEAQQIDTLFTVMLSIGGAIFLLVQGLLVFSIIRFRARPGDTTDGANIHGNFTLEVIWTAIPSVIVLFLVFYSYNVWTSIRTVRADEELVVEALGQRFAWTFTYTDPENRLPAEVSQTFSDSILHTYVGRPVVVRMRTTDVNHAFWVPSMRVKQDMIAGKTTEVRFTPTQPGDYRVVCAELCGGGHGQMYSTIRVYESEDAWLSQFIDVRVDRILNPPDDPVLQGAALLAEAAYPCSGCHILQDDANGIAWAGQQGPSLAGIADTALRRAPNAGLATAEEYLANAIRHPNDYIVPGYAANIMPQFGPSPDAPATVDGAYYVAMPDADLARIIAYLCTQSASGTTTCTDADADGQPDPDAIAAAVAAQAE
jgi:cytochrome c oxidase subunit 2